MEADRTQSWNCYDRVFLTNNTTIKVIPIQFEIALLDGEFCLGFDADIALVRVRDAQAYLSPNHEIALGPRKMAHQIRRGVEIESIHV